MLRLVLVLFCIASLNTEAGQVIVSTTQTRVRISFLCPDHATDDAHDFQIIEHSTNKVHQTIALGDPVLGSDGRVTTTQTISNLNSGVYYGQVRSSTGGSSSAYSAASLTWLWNR